MIQHTARVLCTFIVLTISISAQKQPNFAPDAYKKPFFPFYRSLIHLTAHPCAVALEWPPMRRGHAELRRAPVGHRTSAALCGRQPAVFAERSLWDTDSAHGLKVYPNLAAALVVSGVNQLWRADITYIRLLEEFVYLAVVLDAFRGGRLAGRWNPRWKPGWP